MRIVLSTRDEKGFASHQNSDANADARGGREYKSARNRTRETAAKKTTDGKNNIVLAT